MSNTHSKSDRFVKTDKKGRFGIASILFVSVASLLGAPQAAQANTYYVATWGNDSNPGTSSQPFRTVAKAAAKLVTGDTAYVHSGSYFENRLWLGRSGTAAQPIQLLAYPGETPVIDGANSANSIFIVGGQYVVVSGFEVRNGGNLGIEWWGSNGIVRNTNVHHMRGTGIVMRGNYGLVENNRVSFTSMINASKNMGGGWGVGITASLGQNNAPVKGAILRGNIVSNNYGEGLSTYEADGTIIEKNVVYDNYSANIYISDARNVICRNNQSYFSSNSAIGAVRPMRGLVQLSDERADMPRSANNVVINNMLFNGNLLAFEWTYVAGSGLVNALIANNTLVNGALITRDRGAATKGNKIQNNIFYRNDGGSVASVPSNTGLTFSNNLWSAAPPSTAKGTSDFIGNPQLALTGNRGPGQLTTGFFAPSPTSWAINHGAAIYASTAYNWITSQGAINMGAYTNLTPPIKY